MAQCNLIYAHYGMMSRCSRRQAISLMFKENFKFKGVAYLLVFMVVYIEKCWSMILVLFCKVYKLAEGEQDQYNIFQTADLILLIFVFLFSLPVVAAQQLLAVVVHAVHHVAVQRLPGLSIQCFFCWAPLSLA